MKANGLHLIDGVDLRQIGFIPTGDGAHGLYVSRDSRELFVSNRHEGSISVIDLNTRKVIHKWQLPAEGAPIWEAFQPTEGSCGCPGGTILRFTRSTPVMARY